MEQEKKLSQQESFEVISRMIRTAQNDIHDQSFYYLIWGWLVFFASSGQFLLMQSGFEMSYLTWVILMPLGGIITGIYSYRHKREQKMRTYVDDIMKYVLFAFMVSLFTVLFFQSKLQLATYPLVMMVYGVFLFISGGAIRFRPLVYGGVINWVIGIAAFFVTFEVQLLFLALAVLLGYIIPGHMLKHQYNQKSAMTSPN